MHYLDAYNFIKERLIPLGSPHKKAVEASGEEQLQIEPVDCGSYDELCKLIFIKKGHEDDEAERHKIEYKKEIEQTFATMQAVVISTTTTGGQLGLRVLGPPGSLKSTLAELISCCRSLVHPESKFTGIVSGWNSVKRSQLLASRLNGKCLIVKDADALLQLPNLSQIESELRDALGDAVIRTNYRTGRNFEIYTTFSMIMCGTGSLRQMDSAVLGARFVDISISERDADNKRIVERAIKSQYREICSQLSGGIKIDNLNIAKRKPQILKLAPPVIGFLHHKRQQLTDGIQIKELSPGQLERIHAMSELIAYLRAKVIKDRDGNARLRPEREYATRLGEQVARTLIFLTVVYNENRFEPGDREFDIARKILIDTTFSYPTEIMLLLKGHKTGLMTEDIANEIGISHSYCYEIVQDMKALGVLDYHRVSNNHGQRGQKQNYYIISPDLHPLVRKAGL